MKRQISGMLFFILVILLSILSLLLVSNTAKAGDYFWVGGPGNWTDLDHWADTPGATYPSSDKSQTPINTDDVHFTTSSGLTNGTVNLPASAFCHDLNVNTGSGSGFKLVSSTTSELTIYGDVDVDDVSSNSVLGSGKLFFFTLATEVGVLKTLNFRGDPVLYPTTYNELWNSNVVMDDPDGAAPYEIHGYFQRYGRRDFNYNNADTLNFYGDVYGAYKFLIDDPDAVVTIHDNLTGVSNVHGLYGPLIFSTRNGAEMIVHGRAEFSSGGVSNTAEPGDTSKVTFLDTVYCRSWLSASTVTNATYLDLRNVNFSTLFTWRVYGGNHALKADGSTINLGDMDDLLFREFQGGDEQHVYNNVNFLSPIDLRATNGTDSVFIDSLICSNGILARGHGNVIQIGTPDKTSGYCELNAGMYTSNSDVLVNQLWIDILENAHLNINGSCGVTGGVVFINKVHFRFDPNSILTSSNTNIEDSQTSGPITPYVLGANCIDLGGNIGWSFPTVVPRYLRWVGAVPANVNLKHTFGLWADPANWANGMTFPAAGPGSVGGECPPTPLDSVVFPAQSYVRINTTIATTKSMYWESTGELYDSLPQKDLKRLDIFGSLHMSEEMDWNYYSDVWFRTLETYPTITSNGNNFKYRVLFDATDPSGKWTLTDTLFATIYDNASIPTQIPNTALSARAQNFTMHEGNLYTAGNTVVTYRMELFNGYFDFEDSHIHVWGRRYAWLSEAVSRGLTLNATNSHIFFDSDYSNSNFVYNPSMRTYDGHLFNDVTYKCEYGVLYSQVRVNFSPTMFNNVTFNESSYIRMEGKSNVSINKLETGALVDDNGYTNTIIDHQNLSMPLSVDSARIKTNMIFNGKVEYSSLLKLYQGKIYDILHETDDLQTILAGGKLEAIGACDKPITINGGAFTSPDPQTANDLILTNNKALSNNFTYSNSTLGGITTGWTGVPNPGRTLYWFDGTVGNSLQEWTSKGSWSLASGVMLDQLGGSDLLTGNCPPTCSDTVIFNDASFTGIDTVFIDNAGNPVSCGDLRWLTSSSTSVLDAIPTGIIEICGSMEMAASMQLEYEGLIRFIGVNSGNTIKTNGKTLPFPIVIDGSGEWTLQDDLTTSYSDVKDFSGSIPQMRKYGLFINQGSFITDGHDMTMGFFGSFRQTGDRSINIANSDIRVTGNYSVSSGGVGIVPWNVGKNGTTGSFEFDATGSTVVVGGSSGTWLFIAGGGLRYNNIIFENTTANSFCSRRDTVNSVIFNGLVKINNSSYASSPIFTSSGDALLVADTIIINRKGDGATTGNSYVKLDVNYMEVTNSFTFREDVDLHDKVIFEDSLTYTFGSGKYFHLDNTAYFDAVGAGSKEIAFNATTDGDQAYIRKDSGQLCVDFIYMRDMYAVGNGVLTGNDVGCTSPVCDTLLNDSYVPTKASSGRARFFAGSEANDQGNNAGWDFSPYPPIPSIDIPTIDKNVCSNELLTVMFEFEGVTPAYLTYDSAGVLIDTVLTRPWQNFGSQDLTIASINGDDTTFNWSYTTTMPPFEDSLVIEAVDVTFDRCFIGDANVTGDVKFTRICWDPLPVELLHFYVAKEENTSLLRWETASETNNAYFDVQRSADGKNFYSISKVEGAGNSTQNIAYSFVDESPVSGKNYYRLQQVDFNGDSEYSAVETVDFGMLNTVTIYPNPAKDVLNMETNLKDATVIIRDVSGKMVAVHKILSEQSMINVSRLAAGSYLVEIIDETTTQRTFRKLEILD